MNAQQQGTSSDSGLGCSPSSPLPISLKSSLCLKALFNYDPTRDYRLPMRGLAFSYGDILYVNNASDEDWWQATRVMPKGEQQESGLIPSKGRWLRWQEKKNRKVKFSESSRISPKPSSGQRLCFSRKFPFIKSREKPLQQLDINQETDKEILTYEPVKSLQMDFNYRRPVLILGFLDHRFRQDLISEYPHRFKEHADLDKEQDMHSMLDVSAEEVRNLHRAGIYPIIVMVKPRSLGSFTEMCKRMTDDQIDEERKRIINLEEEDFPGLFTAIVQGDTPEELYETIKSVILQQSGDFIWVPSNEKL